MLGGAGAAFAGGATLGACSASDGPEFAKMKVQLSWLKDVSFAGTYIAASRGWFKDQGLDVTLRAGGPNVVVPPVVAAGTALIGMASTDVTAAARANGAKLKIVGARFQRNPFCIVSLPDAPIRTPHEMVGKRIGVSPTNTLAFRSFLAINGIEERRVQQVPVQFDVTPLTNGEVDGILGYYTSQPNALRTKNIDPVTMLFSSFGFDLYENVYVVKEATLDRHRNLVAAFMAAEIRGWQADVDDPSAGVEVTMDEYGAASGLNEHVQKLINASQIELIRPVRGTPLLAMTEEGISANLALLRDRLKIDAPDDLFDDSVINSALALQ